MKERIIARAYGKSLIELGLEQKVDVAKELTELNVTINENNDLETVLFLDVFTIEEKENVLKDVMAKLKLSPIVQNFVLFMLNEKRMPIFPLIFKEVIVLDDHEKGFLRGVIEGSGEQVDPDFQKKMTDYLSEKLGKKALLEYRKSSKVTAGYKVTMEDLQLDASLDNQLNKFKQTVLNS